MARGVTAKRVGQACIHTLRWTVVMLRNGRLPAGVGALALAAVLTYVVTDARFSVDTVVVTGVAALPGSTVAEASGVLGESVFRVDSAAVAQRVAALPSLQHVDVVTEAPDRLIVHVVERQPVMIWDAGGASFLVDETGDVLGQADPSNPVALPRLQALAGEPYARRRRNGGCDARACDARAQCAAAGGGGADAGGDHPRPRHGYRRADGQMAGDCGK